MCPWPSPSFSTITLLPLQIQLCFFAFRKGWQCRRRAEIIWLCWLWYHHLHPPRDWDFSWAKDSSFQTAFRCLQSSLFILRLTAQLGTAVLRVCSLRLFWGSTQALRSWIYSAPAKRQAVPEKRIRLKFCFQMVAEAKGCWMLCH